MLEASWSFTKQQEVYISNIFERPRVPLGAAVLPRLQSSSAVDDVVVIVVVVESFRPKAKPLLPNRSSILPVMRLLLYRWSKALSLGIIGTLPMLALSNSVLWGQTVCAASAAARGHWTLGMTVWLWSLMAKTAPSVDKSGSLLWQIWIHMASRLRQYWKGWVPNFSHLDQLLLYAFVQSSTHSDMSICFTVLHHLHLFMESQIKRFSRVRL